MKRSSSLPLLVIVGRPNVGKSTLFNAILGQRRAIVGDEPGITRDRIHGEGSHHGRRFELVDTGGIIPNDADLIPSEILRQARTVLERAAHIIFVIDGRAEITAADRDLAQMLRRLGRPVALAVNKIDTASRETLAHEFHVLGFPQLFPVSAEHRLGIAELLDHVTADLPGEPETGEDLEKRSIRVAIIGRPNVGKSTLLNALVGDERAIVSPVAGTTRDAVDERVVANGREFVFVDTAGMRRKGKTRLMAEKLSVVMARRHIRMADVVLLLLDASEGVVALDATIAGYAFQDGRPVVLCVNKWDAARVRDRKAFTAELRGALKFLEYAPVTFLSAKNGTGVGQILPLIVDVYESASKRVPTGELNRFLESLRLEPDLKVLYMTQASVRPPTFVLFTHHRGKLHFSTERYIINRLRKSFGFRGTPIQVKLQSRRR
jgi:GTP-binding protein